MNESIKRSKIDILCLHPNCSNDFVLRKAPPATAYLGVSKENCIGSPLISSYPSGLRLGNAHFSLTASTLMVIIIPTATAKGTSAGTGASRISK